MEESFQRFSELVDTLAPCVYVVDDDDSMRDSLQQLLESISLTVYCYSGASGFFRQWDPDRPGCLITDLRMPEMSGLDLQGELARCERTLPVIFLTGYATISKAVTAMKRGAAHFLSKPADPDELLDTVRRALGMDRRALVEHWWLREWGRRWERLTSREEQVCKLTARGLSNKEVACRLDVSPKTAELHRSHVMEKMGVRSASELARVYAWASELMPAAEDEISTRSLPFGH